jgi:organic hydroperoxide reductase OsmC/OhrA
MGHLYRAEISWHRGEDVFAGGRYSRRHLWRFDGGVSVPASASPQVVPAPWSAADAVDPEEAFVAALSSCHMLFFLSLAAARGLVVEAYDDDAVGVLEKDEAGRMAMTTVTLRPRVTLADGASAATELIEELHHAAHEACFLANSVRTRIAVEPRQGA